MSIFSKSSELPFLSNLSNKFRRTTKTQKIQDTQFIQENFRLVETGKTCIEPSKHSENGYILRMADQKNFGVYKAIVWEQNGCDNCETHFVIDMGNDWICLNCGNKIHEKD